MLFSADARTRGGNGLGVEAEVEAAGGAKMRLFRNGRVRIHAAQAFKVFADFVVGVAEGHAAGDEFEGPVRGEDARV